MTATPALRQFKMIWSPSPQGHILNNACSLYTKTLRAANYTYRFQDVLLNTVVANSLMRGRVVMRVI